MQSLKESPQLVFGVPPMIGKIILVQDLFLRAKKTARIVESTPKFPHIQKNKVRLSLKKFKTIQLVMLIIIRHY